MSTFNGLYVDGLRRRGRRSRVLLWQRTRHPPHGHELTVVNICVRVCQCSEATMTVFWRGHPEEGGGRINMARDVLRVLRLRRLWWGVHVVSWGLRGGFKLARDRLGVTPLAIDRSSIPVVDDGITGADLLVAADHLLGDRELDMDNLRAHRGHPQGKTRHHIQFIPGVGPQPSPETFFPSPPDGKRSQPRLSSSSPASVRKIKNTP